MNTQAADPDPFEIIPAGPTEPTRLVEDERRTLLRAAIMKGASNAQVDLVCAIGNRYGLDPLLQHVVLIDGKPYVTHKGLMHIAHASRQFDGMETTFGSDTGGEFAECHVFRQDMSRPFQARIYLKEYNKGRGAWSTHPRAMASKTVESFCLRRAFDVSLTSQEEMGQDVPMVRDAEWKQAGRAFSAAVGALPREDRHALKAEMARRFGHCDINRLGTPALRMLTREVKAHVGDPPAETRMDGASRGPDGSPFGRDRTEEDDQPPGLRAKI